MATAIMLRAPGGPDALKPEEVEVGRPATGELRVRQTAVGVNFHDVYVRSGLYQTLALPGIPGIEAAGVVEEVGPETPGFTAGDRIAYVTRQYGAYATERLLPARLAVRLPAAISAEVAATMLLKGLTAEMLVREVYQVKRGSRVLVHAAAGGVGRMLCELASHAGATVIGTVGSEEKAELARRAGCAHTILYRQEDFVAQVRDLTGGQGVDVAYDAVGKDTFLGSIDCLALRGHLANYGQASGPVAPLDVSRLFARSNSLSRPAVFHYVTERADLERLSGAVFDAIAAGVLTTEPGRVFPLAEAGAAHAALESRRTTGPLLLQP